MYMAMDVAKYIIEYAHKQNYEVSNLILQKLLYYTQAAFLVEMDRECFGERIVAWAFGPVVVEVYKAYREFGRNNIKESFDSDQIVFNDKTMKIEYKNEKNSIDDRDRKIIEKVFDSYKQIKNPFELVKKTHEEQPWKETRINDEISCDLIKRYYLDNLDRLYY